MSPPPTTTPPRSKTPESHPGGARALAILFTPYVAPDRATQARQNSRAMKTWLDGGDTPAVQALKRSISHPTHRASSSSSRSSRSDKSSVHGPLPEHLTPSNNAEHLGSVGYVPRGSTRRSGEYESFPAWNRSDGEEDMSQREEDESRWMGEEYEESPLSETAMPMASLPTFERKEEKTGVVAKAWAYLGGA